MTTWYDYMVRASEYAGNDGDLWFRYLYKVIKEEETKLTTDDVEKLLKNPTLTPFQKNNPSRFIDRRNAYKETCFTGEP